MTVTSVCTIWWDSMDTACGVTLSAHSAGVHQLQAKIEGQERTYALLVADTVVVKDEGSPEVLTSACNKAWSDVAYFFKVNKAASQQLPHRCCRPTCHVIAYIAMRNGPLTGQFAEMNCRSTS